jgi:hypothetical protein
MALTAERERPGGPCEALSWNFGTLRKTLACTRFNLRGLSLNPLSNSALRRRDHESLSGRDSV